MPTSAPGNNGSSSQRPQRRAGFTLIEVMVVMAIVAIIVAVASLALRDPTRERLEREALRLASLLEMARAESRATSWPVTWVPSGDVNDGAAALGFRFVGLSERGASGIQADRFLESGLRLQISSAGVATNGVRLGPEAVLPPQRVVLELGEERLEVVSDGVEAFSVREPVR